jgi:signal peptidase I
LRIPKPETGRGALLELVVIVALAIGLALGIQAFIVKPYQIPSPSMEPTLSPGERVLVNRFGYHLGDPDVGDVVVFHPPEGAENGRRCGENISGDELCSRPTPERSDTNFIKRIVAGPGDRLRIDEGHPVVDGVVAEEDFINPCRSANKCQVDTEITIPADHYFMMGDNRGASDDSRFWGPVPRDWIIGEAFFTYWPPKHVGLL